MEPRLVTVNDLYAFDPNAVVTIDPFVDIVDATSSSPKKAWVTTTVRSPTCGAPSRGPIRPCKQDRPYFFSTAHPDMSNLP